MARDRYDDDDDDRRRRDDDEDDDRPRRRRDRDDDDDDDDRPRRSRRRRDDDDFDRPPAKKSGGAGLVIAIVLGVVGVVVLAGIVIGVWAYMEWQKVKKESNTLKQIGIGTHSHHDAMGSLPKPYHDEQSGFNPTQDLSNKLSWRVSILPYIEQDNVYRQMRLNEPWDSAANRPFADKPIPQYSDVETPADPTTRVRVFYDNGAVFDTRNRTRITDIMDGTSNTIMYVEGGEKVTWSRFQEYKYDPKGPLPALGKPNKPTFMVVLGDGSVRNLRKTMNETTLRNLITRADGNVVDFDGR